MNPEKYGFSVTPNPDLKWNIKEIDKSISLEKISECSKIDIKELRLYNPEIKQGVIPPLKENATYKFVETSGYTIKGQSRTYRPIISDKDIIVKVLRPQEIPKNIQEGTQDIGISGEDWIKENNADVLNLLNLGYGKVQIVVALSKSNKNKNFSALLLNQIKNKKPLRISTEYLNLAKEYLMNNEIYKKKYGKKTPLITTPWFKSGTNKDVNIMFSFGATEAKPPEEADAIFDVIETGSTLAQNKNKALINEKEIELLKVQIEEIKISTSNPLAN